ncbi:MAG: helix-turn-helix transcriptional regulator [Candidatus Latescibacteria bacterium]|nr:helix-turn-helix transcriptional regulator [Candidatus Latescibacterota bacterium]
MTQGKRSKSRKTSDAVEILSRRFIQGHPDLEAMLAEEETNLEVAEQIYALRTAAGLTQRELAERIGTTASVISRLEQADYEGHSLSMLRRIAAALHHRLTIAFVPLGEATPVSS